MQLRNQLTKEPEAETGFCALKACLEAVTIFFDRCITELDTCAFEVLTSNVTYVLKKIMDDNSKIGILFYENNHYELDIFLEDYLTKMKISREIELPERVNIPKKRHKIKKQ